MLGPGYIKSVLLGVLLIVWPFLNFISHNQQILVNYKPVMLSLVFSLVPLFVVQGLYLIVEDKNKLKKANVLIGFAVLFFFSYPVIYKVCLSLSLFEDNVLIAWGMLFFIFMLTLFYIVSYESVLNFFLVAVFPVVLFLGGDILYFQFDSFVHSESHKDNKISAEYVPKYSRSELPNIYYFILDGYARDDYLKEMFGFNNSEFIEFLKKNGFYVLDNSYSNMAVTKYSIPTTLHMDYYLDSGDGSLSYYSRSAPFFDDFIHPSVDNTPAFKAFSSIGYSIAFGSHQGEPGKNSDIMYILGLSRGVKYEYVEVLKMTPVLDFCQKLDVNLDTIEYRVQQDPDNVLQQIEAIRKGNTFKKSSPPFLFFVHLLTPHPPFVFNADCTRRDDYKFNFDIETTNAILKSNDARDAYLDQLTCLNFKMEKAISNILENDSNSIIVIQADHGWPKGVVKEGLDEPAKLSFRYAIFNAIRVNIPGADHLLYSAMSPVNTFRFIMNLLVEDGPELLPDRSFRVQGDNVIELTETMSRERITGRVVIKKSN